MGAIDRWGRNRGGATTPTSGTRGSRDPLEGLGMTAEALGTFRRMEGMESVVAARAAMLSRDGASSVTMGKEMEKVRAGFNWQPGDSNTRINKNSFAAAPAFGKGGIAGNQDRFAASLKASTDSFFKHGNTWWDNQMSERKTQGTKPAATKSYDFSKGSMADPTGARSMSSVFGTLNAFNAGNDMLVGQGAASAAVLSASGVSAGWPDLLDPMQDPYEGAY